MSNFKYWDAKYFCTLFLKVIRYVTNFASSKLAHNFNFLSSKMPVINLSDSG